MGCPARGLALTSSGDTVVLSMRTTLRLAPCARMPATPSFGACASSRPIVAAAGRVQPPAARWLLRRPVHARNLAHRHTQ